jgi:hypothetical protein
MFGLSTSLSLSHAAKPLLDVYSSSEYERKWCCRRSCMPEQYRCVYLFMRHFHPRNTSAARVVYPIKRTNSRLCAEDASKILPHISYDSQHDLLFPYSQYPTNLLGNSCTSYDPRLGRPRVENSKHTPQDPTSSPKWNEDLDVNFCLVLVLLVMPLLKRLINRLDDCHQDHSQ